MPSRAREPGSGTDSARAGRDVIAKVSKVTIKDTFFMIELQLKLRWQSFNALV
jgi:hypothetical protein